MGHYSDMYDAEQEAHEKKMKMQYTDMVKKDMTKMSVSNLELLAKISKTIDSFQTVFSLISAHRNR